MPIYEYVCEDCKSHYEKIVLDGGRGQITCPICAGPNQTLQFSVFGSPKNSLDRSAGSTPGCACTPMTCGCSEKH